MGKSLIIVESPSKAKTINKYLGKEYVVEASVGHIKNLPKSKLGVDVENGFGVVDENKKVKRVLFHEITAAGVKEGMAHPKKIDKHLVLSQQARRAMDRIVGYKVSP